MNSETKERLRAAYRRGDLQVRAVRGGNTEWCKVAAVLQHSTGHKRAFRVRTQLGMEVEATEDHSLFLYRAGEIVEVAARDLAVGESLAVVWHGELRGDGVATLEEIPALTTSYDLSVPGPENFVLSNGLVAHNSYSIGGVSLDLDKSSKYEAAANNFKDLFDSQLEKAKATVKIIRGLQQPRFGVGIRSSFGPYAGRGVLTPQKFVGF